MDSSSKQCVVSVIKILSCIVSFVFVILAQMNLSYFTSSYHGIMNNWNNDLVTGFRKAGPNEGLVQAQAPWNGSFAGTVEGCYCYRSDSDRGVSSGLHSHSCSYNETYVGCVDVDQIPRTSLPIWNDKNERLHFKFTDDSSFVDLHKNMLEDGSCKSGTKKCGDPSSISTGICVPNSWSECPVSDIAIGNSNPNPAVFTNTIQFTNYNVYFSTGAQSNPVADLSIGENIICEDPVRAGLTPGRSSYTLYRASTSNCKEDTRWRRLDAIAEPLLFDNNAIPYRRLIQFYTSNSYLWYRFFRRVIQWKPVCLNEVEKMNSLADELTSTKNYNLFLTILTCIILGVTILIHAAILRALYKRTALDENAALWMNVFVPCLNVVTIPLMALLVLKARPIYTYFFHIHQRQCSDAFTNDYLDGLHKTIKNDVYLMNMACLVLTLLTMMYDASELYFRRRRASPGDLSANDI